MSAPDTSVPYPTGSELTAAEKIWNDMADRSGGDAFLGDIDVETRDEMIAAWNRIIEEAAE